MDSTGRAILFVCTGNTCRSPMAEGLARHLIAHGLLGEDRNWRIQSAGCWASLGSPATPEAIDVMREMGIDISMHRSQPLTGELIDWASIIFVMSRPHADHVLSLAPDAGPKIRLLDPDGEVPDPIGHPLEVYITTAQQVRDHVEQRLRELKRSDGDDG